MKTTTPTATTTTTTATATATTATATTTTGLIFKIKNLGFRFSKEGVSIIQEATELFGSGLTEITWFENISEYYSHQKNTSLEKIIIEGFHLGYTVIQKLSYTEAFTKDKGEYIRYYYNECLKASENSEFISEIFDYSSEFKKCLDDEEHNMRVFYNLLNELKELEELYDSINTREAFIFCKKIFDDRTYNCFTKKKFKEKFRQISI